MTIPEVYKEAGAYIEGLGEPPYPFNMNPPTEDDIESDRAYSAVKEEMAQTAKKRKIAEANERMIVVATLVERFPGLLDEIAKASDRAIALGVLVGIKPDENYDYKGFRRDLAIAKELNDRIARVNLQFNAHFRLQAAIHFEHKVTNAVWPDWRGYIREQATRLAESQDENEEARGDTEPPRARASRKSKGYYYV